MPLMNLLKKSSFNDDLMICSVNSLVQTKTSETCSDGYPTVDPGFRLACKVSGYKRKLSFSSIIKDRLYRNHRPGVGLMVLNFFRKVLTLPGLSFRMFRDDIGSLKVTLRI